MLNENRLTNASISTMWAIHNYPDLNIFFNIAKSLGFQKIELNHQVDNVMLSRVNFDHYQFSSVHEPCPSDVSTKELVERDWLISAINPEDRRKGIDVVMKSIDLAHQLGAPVVVLHCGMIPFNQNHENTLRNLFRSGKTNSEEYRQIKTEFERARQAASPPSLQAVHMSLDELLEYADRVNIKLGLENRYHYMDIPSLEEMEELLRLADSTRLGFIYDVGHAQALDRLGFYPHDEWLRRYSGRMIGCHLHDVIGLTDHYAPGVGEIDFKHIAKFLPQGAFRTFEMLPGNTLAQVRESIQNLAQLGCIDYL
jgi:sugar phosphate isomerase/epimerase